MEGPLAAFLEKTGFRGLVSDYFTTSRENRAAVDFVEVKQRRGALAVRPFSRPRLNNKRRRLEKMRSEESKEDILVMEEEIICFENDEEIIYLVVYYLVV